MDAHFLCPMIEFECARRIRTDSYVDGGMTKIGLTTAWQWNCSREQWDENIDFDPNFLPPYYTVTINGVVEECSSCLWPSSLKKFMILPRCLARG